MSEAGMGSERMTQRDEVVASFRPGIEPVPTKPQLLNLSASTTEALEPVLCNQRTHHKKKPTRCRKISSCSSQLEKARAQHQRLSMAEKYGGSLKKEKMFDSC